ncbi:unnamed protein product (macronuclear) [Paramecium tetraurelia]|uniref:RGS domain-containing protein n=1 Tax=Paramecium tetraurelia TaxID=5888 RepID=A0E6L6_PARTE|nr:uncharacterized protein GSPATT00003798001 [Paramecium tetraurelia]CAK90933.1 unnamed protein product [Paramecium tetraurelia]|eukprot:XP_001458330.1 hypothetical protein (macronuclear) [Paramecium tetraurelia strain d4-2]
MKKGAKKQNKRESELQQIEEIKLVEIYGNNKLIVECMNDPDIEQSGVIIKLEDLLLESPQGVLLSFVSFYLKLVGMDHCNQYLKGLSLVNVNLEEIINKLESLQLENQSNLIDEQQCQQIENNKVLKQFFDTLFSTQTQLPFQCEGFFRYTYNWLTTISQTKFRTARLAALEVIDLVINSISHFLEFIKDEQELKEATKFINNIFEYLVTNRTQDVQTLIKRKAIQILFHSFLNPDIPTDPYYSYLGCLFLSENHECRESALNELEKIQKSLIESKKSIQPIIDFLQEEQEAVISLIFDPNESVQLKLINFLKMFSKNTNVVSNFFKTKTCQAFIRILFAKNLRVRYESSFLLHLFEKPIKSVIKLTEFYLTYAPFEIQSYEECQNFIFSFVHSHPFVCLPEQYSQFFEGDQQEQFQIMGFYFYASILSYQNTQTKFWWLEVKDEETQFTDQFTSYFLSKVKSSIDLIDENLLFPYLHIYQNLNSKSIPLKDMKAIVIGVQKIFQKSQNIGIINQVCKMMFIYQQQQSDSEVVKDCLKELVKYGIKIYKEKLNFLNLQKIECLIKQNLVFPKQILNPISSIFENKDEKSIIINANLLASSLQNQIRNLLSSSKPQENDHEANYKEIRDLFFNYCFQILENKNKDQHHITILQLVINNLIYTNNFKLQRLNLQYYISSQTYSLLYIHFHNFVLSELSRQVKLEKEKQNDFKRRKSRPLIDNLPQISTLQMELFNNSIKLMNQCPQILTNKEFGIQFLSYLFDLMKSSCYFSDLKPTILTSISQSLQKVIENDQGSKKEDFWKFVVDYSSIHYQSQSEENFNEFIKIMHKLIHCVCQQIKRQ